MLYGGIFRRVEICTGKVQSPPESNASATVMVTHAHAGGSADSYDFETLCLPIELLSRNHDKALNHGMRTTETAKALSTPYMLYRQSGHFVTGVWNL